MNKKEWYQVGEDIKKQVQSAIDSNDFSELSKTISDTVGQAIGDVGKSLNGAFNEAVNETRESLKQTTQKAQNNTYKHKHGEDLKNNGSAGLHQRKPYDGNVYYGKPNLRPDARLFCRSPKGSISGVLYMVFGFSLLGLGGLLTVYMMLMALFGDIEAAGLLATVPVAAAGLALGLRGAKLRGRANRFHRYVGMVKDKLYCSIEEMAQRTGHSKRFIRKDLKKMIQKGMFLQAHMDKQENCFIASDSVYEQYKLMQQSEQMKQKEQTKQINKTEEGSEREETEQNRSECRKVLEEGKEYIRVIRLCNDEIPGEEMSGKLDKLEFLVTRIFDRVEREPELAGELHKMLNYYLPTTQKLLETYRDLDKQNIEVKNISETKREIENTIDTINGAFEKFLDELFREKAWDIQTDISVLNTMLKQDGYLNSDFGKK